MEQSNPISGDIRLVGVIPLPLPQVRPVAGVDGKNTCLPKEAAAEHC